MPSARTLLIGSYGKMGRRYVFIFWYLKENAYLLDLPDSKPAFNDIISKSKKIIVATPTSTHMKVLEEVNTALFHLGEKADVLCEKPICKNEVDLKRLRRFENINLYCVNQYQYLPKIKEDFTSCGPSVYDYYNSGQDGKHWDHFQIYALARGQVNIHSKSPIWVCMINGVECSISDMDKAYISMMCDFLGPMSYMWGIEKIEETTKKILRACNQ